MSARPGNLTDALFRQAPRPTPPAQLSEIESRLVRLSVDLMPGVLMEVRKDDWLAVGGPSAVPEFPRCTLVQLVTAHRISLACAVEIEKPLREVRDHLETRRPSITTDPPPEAP